MASFKSILSNIGHGLAVFFKHVIPGAVAAEPLVDAVFPGVGELFNVVVNSVATAEGIAIAAGQQNGSGSQKLALVLGNPAFQTAITTIETKLGASLNQAQQTAIINAVVAFLNSIPAVENPQTTSSASTTPASNPTSGAIPTTTISLS